MNLPKLTIIIKRDLPHDPTVAVERERLVGLQDSGGDSSRLLTDPYVAIRATGEFSGRALYLSNDYEWVLGLDAAGTTVLVPLKMKK